MRLLTVDEFLKMPEGTVFSYYDRGAVSQDERVRGLYRKGESMDHAFDPTGSRYGKEFGEDSLIAEDFGGWYDGVTPEEVRGNPESFVRLSEFHGWGTTDGVFDDERVYYAVYEPEDLVWMIGTLWKSVRATEGVLPPREHDFFGDAVPHVPDLDDGARAMLDRIAGSVRARGGDPR